MVWGVKGLSVHSVAEQKDSDLSLYQSNLCLSYFKKVFLIVLLLCFFPFYLNRNAPLWLEDEF